MVEHVGMGMNIPERITTELRRILTEIELAGKRQDIEAADRLVKRATELKSLGGQYALLTQKIETALSIDGSKPARENQPVELRRFPVQVSGGMIRQRLLLLTEHVNHRRISVDEKLEIEVSASGEKFTTRLLSDYKLRERGAIGRFYHAADVNEGDVVVLIETAPNRWSLEKAQPGEWDGHYRYKRIRSNRAAILAQL